ncbi:MAG: Xaa-Pro peptidase family protein [Ornithinimicrobium sp.]
MPFNQRLPRDFYDTVQHRLREHLSEAGLDALLTDVPEDVAYLTGFFHHPCERPVAVLIDPSSTILLVPRLEEEHAQAQDSVAQVLTYPEYPGTTPPWEFLARAIPAPARLGVPGSLTLERQRALRAAFPGADLVETDLIVRARYVKHPAELVLHQEAGRITDVMLTAGIALVRDRVHRDQPLPSEAELAAHVGSVGVNTMYDEHTDVVVTGFMAGGLVYSGPNSARPHGLPSGHRLRRGETFMLSLGCAVGGRFVEGERTFVLGEISADQQRYYETVRAAQQVGLDTLRPGLTCAEANRQCLAVIRDAGLGSYLQHRQGHGIGLGMHEPPWLEDGDQTVLQEGFVVSNEPGIYVPGHAGYRISDSMVITADGALPLTAYPKSLGDVIVAV